jgi:sister-chromatid-cohesion protein PDS5
LSVKVRIAFCERLAKVWKEHPELAKDIEGAFRTAVFARPLRALTHAHRLCAAHLQHYLLVDSDDKVRLAACQIFDALDYETASHHVGKSALLTLGERTRDKKVRLWRAFRAFCA